MVEIVTSNPKPVHAAVKFNLFIDERVFQPFFHEMLRTPTFPCVATVLIAVVILMSEGGHHVEAITSLARLGLLLGLWCRRSTPRWFEKPRNRRHLIPKSNILHSCCTRPHGPESRYCGFSGAAGGTSYCFGPAVQEIGVHRGESSNGICLVSG